MRRKATQDDVVSKAELEDFQLLVTSEAVTD
jgi:hypothetical protein